MGQGPARRWSATDSGFTERKRPERAPTDAELLRGTKLLLDIGVSDEPDAWYEHELVGLRAILADGTDLGEVIRLDAGAAQDLLVVRRSGGGQEVLVPFVAALVPEVDIAGGRVVLDPPGGMFDPEEA